MTESASRQPEEPTAAAGQVVGVVNEARAGERRVAASPASARALVQAGHRVVIEAGAGAAAGWADTDYTAVGAEVGTDAAAVFSSAAVLLCVRGSGPGSASWTAAGATHTLVGLFDPLGDPQGVLELAGRGTTVFAIDLLPRITRAQPMDVLTSQATVAGYKAVVLAASMAPRLFPMLTYAAGTIPPAKVLVLGAGVAGLQAIATARRLGANVSAYDVRAAVREQIESLGARFVDLADVSTGGEDASGYATGADEAELARQRDALAVEIAASDVVVTTALVPGQRSPILVTAAAIEAMKPGSVVVDLAAERGGNCEGTVAGTTVMIGGVTLLGAENLPATVPQDASMMLGRNLANFVLHVSRGGSIDLDSDDPIITGTLVTRGGAVVHERVAALTRAPATPPDPGPAVAQAEAEVETGTAPTS